MHHPQAGRMNSRHLPAGQAMPGGAAGVGAGALDMGPGPVPGGGGVGGGGGGGGGPGGGPRRRGPPPYAPHQHQHQQHHFHQQMPMYASAYGVNPYPGHYYQQLPPHYQNGAAMPGPYGMPYQPAVQGAYAAARSPPSMHQFVPMVGVTVPPSYQRPSPQSPALNTPYQPPTAPAQAASAPAPAPATAAAGFMPGPHTPSSTHSSAVAAAALPVSQLQQRPPPMHPAPQSPPTPQRQEALPLPPLPPTSPSPAAVTPIVAPAEPSPPLVPKEPFRPPLPWLSRPDLPFPSSTPKLRRKRRVRVDDDELVMPDQHEATPEPSDQIDSKTEPTTASGPTPTAAAALARSETPSTQDLPSEDAPSTSPTTPSSVQQAATATSVTPTGTSKPASRPAVPAVPIVPAVPRAAAKPGAEKTQADGKPAATPDAAQTAQGAEQGAVPAAPDASAVPAPAPAPARPKLWTGLFANPSPAAPKPAAGPNGTAQPASVSGDDSASGAGAATGSALPSFTRSSTSSLAEALREYRVGAGEKLSFIEPRGLINTGNMCYMNSVLQVLLFCVPFYDFLDQVYKKASHSFKSETPLIDAMILFMKEFRVIDAAASVDQLRMRLKNEELEQYGEAFTPEFVYEVIRKLPRFASMRRGHQQDAEEFLGFLLQSLDDECTQVMGGGTNASSAQAPQSSSGASVEAGDDWLEVGRKQRPAVTRSSGASSSSPVSRIFGGVLRSELRVPRLKDSITTEPFQPLQLDIGAPDVRNIVDALKGITRIETLHGDFGSPLGKDGRATKQVFIETLPPVLILHLKRFQFDAEGNGTVKIWKKVGYPLELEIPREVFSRQKRNSILAAGGDGAAAALLPRYRLIAVVYHHGKNASGGHYTVDVRRQDGREWIRLDDTVIRRVRSEEVAEAGADEPPSREAGGGSSSPSFAGVASSSSNRFGAMDGEDAGDEGWNQVSGSGTGGGGGTGGVNGGKRWSSVVNGAGASPGASPSGAAGSAAPKGKQVKEGVKDNKVAYLLFYQRV